MTETLTKITQSDIEGIEIFLRHVSIYLHPSEFIHWFEPEDLKLWQGKTFNQIYQEVLSALQEEGPSEEMTRVFWVLHNGLMEMSTWLASDENYLPTGGQVEKMRQELEEKKPN